MGLSLVLVGRWVVQAAVRYSLMSPAPGEPDDEFGDLGVDWRSASFCGWWLGPVSGDETSVPTDRRPRVDDKEHLGETAPVGCDSCRVKVSEGHFGAPVGRSVIDHKPCGARVSVSRCFPSFRSGSHCHVDALWSRRPVTGRRTPPGPQSR